MDLECIFQRNDKASYIVEYYLFLLQILFLNLVYISLDERFQANRLIIKYHHTFLHRIPSSNGPDSRTLGLVS